MNKGISSVWPLLAVILFLTSATLSCSRAESNATDGKMNDTTRIMLVGASVGQAWDLPALPARKKYTGIEFESIAVYQFDKTEALDEILMRPKRKPRMTLKYFKGLLQPAPRKPDIIIVKECAAYFPGDMRSYEAMVKGWVQKIRANRVRPVLATVVPVTRERAGKRQGQIDTILEFNDWVRDFAKREGIAVLDLEAALRISDRERFLKDDLTSGDGLHLNRKAYDILDGTLLSAVKTL